MRKKREKLDWHRSVEEHDHQEDVYEEMASLLPRRVRDTAYAAASIVGMIQKDIDSESAVVQRCPKCNHHTFRKLRPEEKASPGDSNWLCSQCGNTTDEFGNKL